MVILFLFPKRSQRILPHRRNKMVSQHCQTIDQPFDDEIERNAFDMSALESTSHLPPSIFCPISRMPMQDPVIAMDGNSYERREILKWLKKKRVSPLTGYQMNTTIVPNHTLRNTISDIINTS